MKCPRVNIAGNKIFAYIRGISLNQNDGALVIAVNNNTITMDSTLTDGPSDGIFVGELGIRYIMLPDPVIYANNITMGRRKVNNGLNMGVSNRYQVNKNTVNMKSFGSKTIYNYGMRHEGCPDLFTSCNVVSGTGSGANNTLNSNNAFAVRTVGCTNYTHSCDSITDTYYGFYFDALNIGNLRTNKITRHIFGLYVTTSGVMSSQDHQGNLWRYPYSLGQYGAYVNSNDQFKYRLPAGNKIPNLYFPFDLFQLDNNGQDKECDLNTCE